MPLFRTPKTWKKKSTCGNSEMATRRRRTVKGILCLSGFCAGKHEIWSRLWQNSRNRCSGVSSKPFTQTLKKISFRPHCSSLTLLLQLCYDTLDVVDPETRCMRLVCNLRRDSDPAKAATSASLQQGPDSSDCHWQQLSTRRFAENTLQARVRNCSIY